MEIPDYATFYLKFLEATHEMEQVLKESEVLTGNDSSELKWELQVAICGSGGNSKEIPDLTTTCQCIKIIKQ